MQGFFVVAEIYQRQAAILTARAATYRKAVDQLCQLFDSVG
jgi:hypothetical protein